MVQKSPKEIGVVNLFQKNIIHTKISCCCSPSWVLIRQLFFTERGGQSTKG